MLTCAMFYLMVAASQVYMGVSVSDVSRENSFNRVCFPVFHFRVICVGKEFIHKVRFLELWVQTSLQFSEAVVLEFLTLELLV